MVPLGPKPRMLELGSWCAFAIFNWEILSLALAIEYPFRINQMPLLRSELSNLPVFASNPYIFHLEMVRLDGCQCPFGFVESLDREHQFLAGPYNLPHHHYLP